MVKYSKKNRRKHAQNKQGKAWVKRSKKGTKHECNEQGKAWKRTG